MDPDKIEPRIRSKQEKEIAPEFVERVQSSPLKLEDKINLLLVKGGVKSAASISFDVKISGDGMKTEVFATEVQAQEVKDLVESSGLFFKKREDAEFKQFEPRPDGSEKYYDQEHVSYFVSETEKGLKKLLEAQKSGNSKLLGRAYGFAPTAISAWTNEKNRINRSDLPDEYRNSDAAAFTPGALSKEHWRDELAYYQERADFIQRISPALFNQMTEK